MYIYELYVSSFIFFLFFYNSQVSFVCTQLNIFQELQTITVLCALRQMASGTSI